MPLALPLWPSRPWRCACFLVTEPIAPGHRGGHSGAHALLMGVKHGLMPFAENIGYLLPGRRVVHHPCLWGFCVSPPLSPSRPSVPAGGRGRHLGRTGGFAWRPSGAAGKNWSWRWRRESASPGRRPFALSVLAGASRPSFSPSFQSARAYRLCGQSAGSGPVIYGMGLWRHHHRAGYGALVLAVGIGVLPRRAGATAPWQALHRHAGPLFPVAAVLAVAIFGADLPPEAPAAVADLPWYRETPLPN